MILTSIAIDGKEYHAQQEWDDDLETYKDEIVPLLDENGDYIPIETCLCHAYAPGECCCATTSWENYRYEDDYDF